MITLPSVALGRADARTACRLRLDRPRARRARHVADVQPLAVAARAAGCAALVRLPGPDENRRGCRRSSTRACTASSSRQSSQPSRRGTWSIACATRRAARAGWRPAARPGTGATPPRRPTPSASPRSSRRAGWRRRELDRGGGRRRRAGRRLRRPRAGARRDWLELRSARVRSAIERVQLAATACGRPLRHRRPRRRAAAGRARGGELHGLRALGGRAPLRARRLTRGLARLRAELAPAGEGAPVSAPEAWHVTRTLRAMEQLAVRPRSAPELADGLGVHVRTARRILKRLESEGYVVLKRRPPAALPADHAGRGPRRPGGRARGADPDGRRLRDGAARGAGTRAATCACPATCRRSASCTTPPSERGGCRPHLRELVPCHCTAAGKALLAWRESWRDAVLAEPLESFTDRTTTGPGVAAARARTGRWRAALRRRGPRARVRFARGRGAGVLWDSGEGSSPPWPWSPRSSGLPAERYGELGGAVMEAAAALSRELGFVPAHARAA